MEFIPIKSPTDEMVEAGLVEVINGYIELTEKGKETAREVEKSLRA